MTFGQRFLIWAKFFTIGMGVYAFYSTFGFYWGFIWGFGGLWVAQTGFYKDAESHKSL